MEPVLWGPGLWHLLFSIAWNCRDGALVSYLLRVVLFHVPTLLPCRLCQGHYVRNHALLKHRYGEPKTAEEAFKWLYFLKDEVNKRQHIRSVPFKEFRTRFSVFGGPVNDVLVADTILLISIAKEEDGDDEVFVEFCKFLSKLLPLPHDSELVKSLSRMRDPIVVHSYIAFRNTRIEHGIAYPTLKEVRDSLA